MLFLDSSFLVALYNTRDIHNKRALELMSRFSKEDHGGFAISDYVFDEFINVFLNKYEDIGKAKKYGKDVLDFTTVFFCSERDFKNSWELFDSQKNTTLNFTDCSIISLMENKGMNKIATFDKDFKKVQRVTVVD
ncbi:hypothetical protein AUJ84_00175 [Candidatus Pacearchaeota archaeon CG1_02_32_132]|nr:MAG: hypothetical protein AUJ84_00175 [Candidatus Pacearchaeota archaeon CG1_02_32_132]